MPGMRCAVAFCTNSAHLTKPDPNSSQIIYHRFPINKEARKKWIHLCQRTENFNPETCRVCSDHFADEDYERDLKNELLGLPLRKLLKKNAMPSLKLGKESASSQRKVLKGKKRNERLQERNRKLLVNSLLQAAEVQKDTEQPQNHIDSAPMQTIEIEVIKQELEKTDSEDIVCSLLQVTTVLQESEMDVSPNKYSLTETERLTLDHINLQKEFNEMKAQFKHTMETLKECQKQLALKNIYIKQITKELKRLKSEQNSKKKVKEQTKQYLRQVFTENQAKIIMNSQKQAKWSKEDISIASTLFYISEQAYTFLREELNFPLPGKSSVQRWAATKKLQQNT